MNRWACAWPLAYTQDFPHEEGWSLIQESSNALVIFGASNISSKFIILVLDISSVLILLRLRVVLNDVNWTGRSTNYFNIMYTWFEDLSCPQCKPCIVVTLADRMSHNSKYFGWCYSLIKLIMIYCDRASYFVESLLGLGYPTFLEEHTAILTLLVRQHTYGLVFLIRQIHFKLIRLARFISSINKD